MFLDMLTADAASKHGHEFSEPQQANRWLGGRRSPFKVLPYAGRPRVPTRSRSVRGVMGELSEVPEESDPSVVSRYYDMSVDDLHIPGSYRHDSPPASPPRIRPSKPRLYSAPSDLQPTSAFSAQEPVQPAPALALDKKSRRPKTQFSVAIPPPCALPLRKQGIARPRALFQLQTRADSKFHRPIYELVPLSRIDGSRKVGQLIRRLGKAKDNITNDDLAVVRVESYSSAASRRDSLELPETRDILGIISPLPKQADSQNSQAQIFLDGAIWEANTANDGRYSLHCVGTEKHHARWYVPKTQKQRAQSLGGLEGTGRKLYFAAILPHTTKHPTLASLSNTNLDIYDSYTLNTETGPVDALTPLETTTPLHSEVEPLIWPVQHTETSSTNVFNVPIDELHRKLIVVSSFWVMLCEGWSSQYTFPVVTTSNTQPKPTNDRTMSLPITKDDKLSISSITQPSSSISTRQPTPERHSISAASPAPSVNTEASLPKSKRLSLNSFTFGRSQNSTLARNAEVTISLAGATSSTPDTPQVVQGRSTQLGPLDRDPSVTDDLKSSLQRNDLDDSDPSSPVLVRQTTSRLSSMIRRVSNNVTTRDDRDRRSRSISWRWQHSAREETVNATPQEADLTLSEFNSVTSSIASTAKDLASPPFDEKSGLFDRSTVASSFSAPSHHDRDYVHTVQGESVESAVPSVVTAPMKHITTIPARDHAERHANHAASEPSKQNSSPDMHTPASADRNRWSFSSSDSQQFDGTRPYWKEFDRLQMDNFWGRTPSMIRPVARSPEKSEVTVHTTPTRHLPQLGPLDSDVVASIEQPEEAEHPTRSLSMMENFRQTFRRRRQSSFSRRLFSNEPES